MELFPLAFKNESLALEDYLKARFYKYRRYLMVLALSRILLISAFAILLGTLLYNRGDDVGAVIVILLWINYFSLEYSVYIGKVNRAFQNIRKD